MCEEMNEFCGCTKPKLINEIEGATLIVRCQICGESAATTNPDYFKKEEWEEDESTYQLWLSPRRVEKKKFVQLFQDLAKDKILEAASKYTTGNAALLFEGGGEEFHSVASKLRRLEIEYEIKPPYPYCT